MTISKINDKDIESLKVASLPSRPTAPTAFGGAGYTAKEMKSAFDRLPLYIISRINDLIGMIGDENGIVDAIPSGISEGHTLKDLTRDISSGRFSTYLSVLGEPLSDKILSIGEELTRLELLIGTVAENTPENGESLSSLTSRISDIETNLASVLGSLSELSAGLDDIKAEILAAATELVGEESEKLKSELMSEIDGVTEELTTEIYGFWDTLSDRIDTINSRLEGTSELIIDCGGPGSL